jgi:ferredoxin-NADP reductase
MGTAAKQTIHLVKLKERQQVAEKTLAFRFEKPADFSFKPGQFMEVSLIDPSETDSEGNTRTFSIASAPHEATLMVTTRVRDTAFKRVLRAIPISSQVRIEGPFGNFTLHNNAARPAVLLAGGIGITPFRSMVFRAAEEKLPHRLFLFYSNRRPEDAAFLDELQSLEDRNPNYRCIATMTEMAKSQHPWNGETGYVDREMLSRHLKDAASPIYYIAGPPAMVNGVKALLNRAGIDDDDIRWEDFAGY